MYIFFFLYTRYIRRKDDKKESEDKISGKIDVPKPEQPKDAISSTETTSSKSFNDFALPSNAVRPVKRQKHQN